MWQQRDLFVVWWSCSSGFALAAEVVVVMCSGGRTGGRVDGWASISTWGGPNETVVDYNKYEQGYPS